MGAVQSVTLRAKGPGDIGVEVERPGEPGQVEHLTDRRLKGRKPKASATRAHALEQPNQRGQAGAIDEWHGLEIQHELMPAAGQEPIKLLDYTGAARDVKISGHPD